MFHPNDWVIIWVEGEGDLRGRVIRQYCQAEYDANNDIRRLNASLPLYEVAVPGGSRFVREQENNIRPLLDPSLDDYIRVACCEEPNLSLLTATMTNRGLVSIAHHIYVALEEWAAARCVKPGAIKAEWQMYQGEKEGNDGK